MATLNNSTDTKIIILKGNIMLSLLVIICGLFGILFFILSDKEMEFRNKKELFKANILKKWMYGSALISMTAILIAIILG